MKKANERLIEQLLLCDPITECGKEMLRDLGLKDVITPSNYFGGSAPHYAHSKKTGLLTQGDDTIPTFAPDKISAAERTERYLELYERFSPSVSHSKENKGFTVLIGASGSGKSTELHRLVYSNYRAIPFGASGDIFQEEYKDTICENAVYVDMTHISATIPRGSHGYKCVYSDDALDLFFSKLLETLVCYIEFLHTQHREKLKEFRNNIDCLDKYFSHQPYLESYLEESSEFIDIITNYACGKDTTIDDVFDNIIKHIGFKEQSLDSWTTQETKVHAVAKLLSLLRLVMLGTFLGKNKIIIVDNVEALYTSNGIDMQTSILAIRKIYEVLYSAYHNDLDFIGNADPVHFVIALRRTTWQRLQFAYAGTHTAINDNLFDITEKFTISELWRSKAYPIWNKYLKTEFDESSCEFISAVNNVYMDSIRENSILQKYARMMPNDLRKQGHWVSIALFDIFCNERFGIINNNSAKYINKVEFAYILSPQYNNTQEARYLLKSAAVEYLLMEQFAIMTDENVENDGVLWNTSNVSRNIRGRTLAHYYNFNGKRRTSGAKYLATKPYNIRRSDSIYYNTSQDRLRQLLFVLSNTNDDTVSSIPESRQSFVSLYEVAKKVVDSRNGFAIEEDLLLLSKMILAGSRDNIKAVFSPLFSLQSLADYNDAAGFRDTLKEIWKAPQIDSDDGEHPFCRQKFGISITESGKELYANIQPSFEYFSALFCYDFPPLLFIKTEEEIAHVIGCIYHNAENVCSSNEMPETVALRMEVRKRHTQFLDIYRNYIEKMWETVGFSHEQKNTLVESIQTVIYKYRKWAESA